MPSRRHPESTLHTGTPIEKIQAEVKQAAIDHLQAEDARTALGHFTDDAIAVSNTTLFPTVHDVAKDVHACYDILKSVYLAVWDDLFVKVISQDAALVTAAFR